MGSRSFHLICFKVCLLTTVWSAEPMSPEPTAMQLQPLEAFWVQNVDGFDANTSNPSQQMAGAFLHGMMDGFSSYARSSYSLIHQLVDRDFHALSQEAVLALLNQHLGKEIDYHKDTTDGKTSPDDIKKQFVENVFVLVREAVYQELLKTGQFGNQRQVYVRERDVTETQYDVTLNMSQTFVRAILPHSFLFRDALLSIVGHDKVDAYLMGKIDKLFVRLTLKYANSLIGNVNPNIFQDSESLRILGLSGEDLIKTHLKAKTALSKRNDQNKEKAFADVWKYIKVHLTHHIRNALVKSILTFSRLAVDKVSEPVVIKIAQTLKNNATGIQFVAGTVGYHIGTFLIPVSIVGGAVVAVAAYWTASGVVYGAVPQGLEELRQDFIQLGQHYIQRSGEYYVGSFLPLSENEHDLYGLNPNPSPLELSLFSHDYEEHDRLTSQKLMGLILKDVANIICKPFSVFLSSENIRVPVNLDNPDQLNFLSALHGDHPVKKSDALVRVEFYRLVKAIHDCRVAANNFQEHASWLRKIQAYISGQFSGQIELTATQKELFATLKKYPSFQLRHAELQNMINLHILKKQPDDRSHYNQEVGLLSEQFIVDVTQTLDKIDIAKAKLSARDQNPGDIDTMMKNFAFDQFIQALDVIIQNPSHVDAVPLKLTAPRHDIGQSIAALEAVPLYRTYETHKVKVVENLDNMQEVANLGMDVYFLTKTILDMLKEDEAVFAGRTFDCLDREDFVKISKQINQTRMNLIQSQEDRLYLEQNEHALAAFFEASMYKDTVTWTYDSLIGDYKKQ